MIAWFTRNDVAANLLMLSILLLGTYSLATRIPLEVFPTFGANIISVNVSLRGSTPEESEQSVTIRIEEAIQDLEGIKKISSRSSEGSSNVTIEVDDDYDPRELLNDVKTRVDAINTFPGEAEKPVISLALRTREVITVSVAGNFTEKEIRQQAERVRDDLLGIAGITQLELDDVRDYEISVEVSQDRLRQYGLRLSDVAEAINSSSLDLSAGNVKTSGGEVLIRLKGQAYLRPDFENIVVTTNRDGSIVRVGDLANVRDAFTEDPIQTRFDGRPAAMIEVYRVGNQSAIDVASKVKQYVAEQQARLPQGMELATWRDDSKVVEGRLNTLVSNALQGGILVMILLTLFLRPAVAAWVFVGIPVSFMGAFIVMPFAGISLNIMSLFGFILVLGIVVDDAIVTGENIYRHLKTNPNSEQAALLGTKEVAAPVTFGVLTTISAFVPLLLAEGQAGVFFVNMAGVVVPILIFSLIESKFVLPAHLKHLKYRRESDHGMLMRWQHKIANGFEDFVLRYYRPVLNFCLANRYATIATFLGLFILLSTTMASGWLRFIFLPHIPAEQISVSLAMPSGTPFEVTDRHIEKMANAALQLKEKYRDKKTGESLIQHVYATTGSGGGGRKDTNYGRVRFEMIPAEERHTRVSNPELVSEWRDLIGPIPGAEEISFRSEIAHIGNPIEIQLRGNDGHHLRDVGDKLKDKLATHAGVFDIKDSMTDGKEELRIRLKPEAYVLGLTESDVIRQVREAFYGYEAQRIQRGRDDVRIMVRFPREERSAIANLQDFRIRTADGRSIPVAQVAELIPGESPTAIYRNDLKRTLTVTADVNKNVANMTVINASLGELLDNLLIPYPDISYRFEGEAREQAESFESLAYGLAFVLFAIYTLLAIPFKSYSQPLIVMSIIPFGTLGAFVGHWILGMDLSLFSLFGLLALVGVVVNDSLVLVDFINRQRREHGVPVLQAIQTAGVVRFRPVMLTSLTTFFGLLPLLFETSTQAQFLKGTAASLAFGILFATFITLLLVPVNYLIAWELKQWFKNRGHRVKSELNSSQGDATPP